MKSKTLWKQPSNGPLKKQLWLKRTWEESDSMCSTSSYMLMPSIEVVVKSSQQPEESTMPLNWLLNPDSKNLSSCVRSSRQMMLWVVSINAWPKEEDWSLGRNLSMELLWSSWKPTCLLLSHSDSLNIWEPWPQEEPSLNACLIIGKCSQVIHSMPQAKLDL